MNSRRCPICNLELQIKHAQFMDLYICNNCNKKYKESDLVQGKISIHTTFSASLPKNSNQNKPTAQEIDEIMNILPAEIKKLLKGNSYQVIIEDGNQTKVFSGRTPSKVSSVAGIDFLHYSPPKPQNKVIVAFTGLHQSVKKFMLQSRYHRYLDEYNYDLIVVSKSAMDKIGELDYAQILNDLIIPELINKFKLNLEETHFMAFSHGGVFLVPLVFTQKIKSGTFISCVMDDAPDFIDQIAEFPIFEKNKLFIIDQERDLYFTQQNNYLMSTIFKPYKNISLIPNPKGTHKVYDCRDILFDQILHIP